LIFLLTILFLSLLVTVPLRFSRRDAGVMNSQLLDEAIKVIPDPQILINMVSKRVRQLSAGSRAMVAVEGRMGLADIALAEIAQGKLVLAQTDNGEKPEE
jgi:DNA-directed RNA polymerase subunit omega